MMIRVRAVYIYLYIYTRKAVACKTVRFLLRIKSCQSVCVLMAAEIDTFFLQKQSEIYTHLHLHSHLHYTSTVGRRIYHQIRYRCYCFTAISFIFIFKNSAHDSGGYLSTSTPRSMSLSRISSGVLITVLPSGSMKNAHEYLCCIAAISSGTMTLCAVAL